jgi:hypothetical protein
MNPEKYVPVRKRAIRDITYFLQEILYRLGSEKEDSDARMHLETRIALVTDDCSSPSFFTFKAQTR